MAKALLIVDMQQAFFGDENLASRRDELVQACNRLSAAARRSARPVILARTMHRADRSTWTLNMRDDDAGFLLEADDDASYLEGLDTNAVTEIVKTRDSAFWQTNLLDYLRTHDIDQLVIAGVSTHLCIAQTSIDAYNANIRVELARDAIASNKPGLHEPFLALLHDEYRIALLDSQTIEW